MICLAAGRRGSDGMERRRGGFHRPLLLLLVVVPLGEGDHIHAGEHVVADLDRGDLAGGVAVDEEDPAVVPEILAVLLAGFDLELHVFGGHWIFLSCLAFR